MVADDASLLAAARRILDDAGRDLAREHWLSACVSSQRAAVMATEVWLRNQGQPQVSGSVHENVSLWPGAGAEIREAAALLDRHRIEEGYPHRSSSADTDPRAEADRVVAAGHKVLAFVEEQLTEVGGEG